MDISQFKKDMKININNLKLIPYSAAGNVTPVLDISHIEGIYDEEVREIREYLENEIFFRTWLQEEGRKYNADTVMIYFRKPDNSFVTFIGEPNAPIVNGFSDMCGNGIRALALHIVLSEKNEKVRRNYLEKGINIFAGEMRNVTVEEIDFIEGIGSFKVNMGIFQTSSNALSKYVDFENLNESLMDHIGFNGVEEGEPHLVSILSLGNFVYMLEVEGIQIDLTDDIFIIENLRSIAARLGVRHTFDLNTFPKGINFNLTLVIGESVYVATHERNLSQNTEECNFHHAAGNLCKCCTEACGTGGAAVANILFKHGHTKVSTVRTIHSGGEIIYTIGKETFMTGPAMSLSEMEEREIEFIENGKTTELTQG